uniref:Radical S-adenosyl methionine domain-containing protein n=1 Tax=Pelodiscus sinensis TaxID=13735 RepID=K7FKI5_PELSI
WPYCQKRCSYCNFNKYIPRGLDEASMRSCLTQEARTLIQLSQVHRISSVFFGGGTPSLASPQTIAAVLETISRCAHLAADASRLAEFRASGINRLSIGIQSLDDAELILLGRDHTAHEALGTLEEAKKLFPGRTSIDLIFGLPGQSVASWTKGLEELLQQCDDHVSLYQLTLERGTSLFRQVQQGSVPAPKQEVVAEMYEVAREMLRDTGYRQYEVSNFARNGALSAHNLSYWQGSQYIGIGPGAHGRFVPRAHGENLREARIQTLEPDSWMKEVQAFGHGTRKRAAQGELEVVSVSQYLQWVSPLLPHQHWLQFAPSLSLWDVFGTSVEVKELEDQGLLLLDNRGLRCSWKGLAVLDSLLLTLLNQLQQSWEDR